ncbi:MAG: DNA repair protein [Saprospiraceae bacterium]|nr:DNA repair protein [Saprospiraceae bacterium]
MHALKTSIESTTTLSPHALTSLPFTTLTFPEIHLETRDAHKLRGYFGNLFKEHSPLLHNHFEDGKSRYAYPLVQYKVLRNVPTLVGMGEGADLLAELFLKTQELDIEGKVYPLFTKEIKHSRVAIGMADGLVKYRFETFWMALNQENHRVYMESDESCDFILLERILVGNILSFFKAFGHFFGPEERVRVELDIEAYRSAKFKDNKMAAFTGHFETNVLLPDFIGLGKSVSRGFGTIRKIS